MVRLSCDPRQPPNDHIPDVAGWKEALAMEHVELACLPESEPPESPDNPANQVHSDASESNIPLIAGNRSGDADGLTEVSNKTQQDKGLKKKYIPKQRGSNIAS
ncbi:hypothetical protein MLD38_002884 [Melastoma candidum]|uniref:Uncharacterized protein n=1 Tax=Melastoma candidum TaxID=119954 RepID=A0ACB9S0G1_9MYRT|nr:hypothetical protein MLD38_002884 [Melastoma candidum]